MKNIRSRHLVLFVIMGLSLVVLIAQHTLGWWVDRTLQEGISRETLWGMLSVDALQKGRYWVLFTHIFVHADVWHWLANTSFLSVALYALVRLVAPVHLLAVFILSGLVGGLAQLYYNYFMGVDVNLLGSSAASAGMLFAVVALCPNLSFHLPFARHARLQLRHVALCFILVSLGWAMKDVLQPPLSDQFVANAAHLGGALAGWQFGHFLACRRRHLAGLMAVPATPSPRRLQSKKTPRNTIHRSTRPISLTALSTKTSPVRLCITPEDEAQALEMLLMDSYQEPFRPHLLTKREDLLRVADELLDKISEHGFSSLSLEERAALEHCSQTLAAPK